MNDYLLRYAIDNVWCNPTMDRQFQYELRQLTPKYGTKTNYVVDYEDYKLPGTSRDVWHVYQIGQVIPSRLAIPKLYNQWMSLQLLANAHDTLAEVYVTNGIMFPRADTYVLVTSTQNLLVAVKVNDRLPSLDENKPYIHFYSNAFFQSKRSIQTSINTMIVESFFVTSEAALRQFQLKLIDIVAEKGGFPMYWVNGRLVQDISLITATTGDTVEMLIDGSIKGFRDYPLTGLPTFTSTLDNQAKYILHPTTRSTTIEYFDDVAMYLIRKNPSQPTRFSGVNYHRNEGNWARMLTHQDYSVPVSRVQEFVTSHPEDPRINMGDVRFPSDLWNGFANVYMRVYTRHSGYLRPLIADVSRIQDLYKLSDTNIIRAMTGADSMPLWQAKNLEKAAYVQFMSAAPDVIYPITFQDPAVTSEGKVAAQNFAGDVFGYHEAAHLLANNPTKVTVDQGIRLALLPYAYWEDATVFEYDNKGVLIDYYYHTAGQRYITKNVSCTMVEAITGTGGNNLKGVYGNAPVPLPDGYNYRVYVNPVWGGVPTGEWIDITDLPNAGDWGFMDETGAVPTWTWLYDPTKWQGLVRHDRNFFMETYRFAKATGVIRFSFRHQIEINGVESSRLMDVPFGQLDVFLNKRPLIEGLDYVVIQGATFAETQVVVCNLEYLNGTIEDILIRGTGFCSPQLKLRAPNEVGFIEYGVMSNNAVYDLHTHKMQRIIVDGHYRAPEDLVFEEQRNSFTITSERNGAPYQIQTPQVTFRDVYKFDATARALDDERDKQVSNYLTQYLPQRTRPNPDQVTQPYHVFSAYINKVLTDLRSGQLVIPYSNGRLSDEAILTAIAPYEWLKPFDLCNRTYNTNHVNVYPHWENAPVGLDILQFDFLNRVVDLSLQNPPDLSPFFIITRT